MERRKIKHPFILLFLLQIAILVVFSGIGILYTALTRGGLENAFSYFLENAMSDFGQVIYFCLSDNPYHSEFYSSYTPLCMLLTLPFALICKGNPLFYTLKNPYSPGEYNTLILGTWEYWLAYVLYVAVFLAAFLYLSYRLLSPKIGERIWFALALFFSNLGIYSISRGNNVQHIVLFLMAFLLLYRSPKLWQRQVALVCLAIAGVCKYYPFVFGVLLLREKRFRDILCVILYSLVLFFLPFFLYEGGLSNLPAYFSNFGRFAGGEERVSDWGNLSGYSLLSKLLVACGMEADGLPVQILCLLFDGCILVSCVWLAIASDDRFVQRMMFACAMTLIPPVSYYYLLLFLVFPIFAFAEEWDEIVGARRYFYLAFFAYCSFLPAFATLVYLPQTLCFLAAIAIEWTVHRNGKKRRNLQQKESSI